MGYVGAGSAPACRMDQDCRVRAGIPDDLWVSGRVCYLLLALENAATISAFLHQPDYSPDCAHCGAAGRRACVMVDGGCHYRGTGLSEVSAGGGKREGAGGR